MRRDDQLRDAHIQRFRERRQAEGCATESAEQAAARRRRQALEAADVALASAKESRDPAKIKTAIDGLRNAMDLPGGERGADLAPVTIIVGLDTSNADDAVDEPESAATTP